MSLLEEAHKDIVPEVRAYKLGRQRWSYNQCEMQFVQEGSAKAAELTVAEAWHSNQNVLPHEASDSQVCYQMRLSNNVEVCAVLYIVHTQATQNHDDNSISHPDFQWACVSRSECSKQCEGPILRPLKRTGLVTSKTTDTESNLKRSARRQAKDARYMYVAIDEACTHIGVKSFRLVAGVYDKSCQHLLGTACSLPIRVVSNNDAPGGAAHITLSASIRRDWSGWQDGPSRQLNPMPLMGSSQNAVRVESGAWAIPCTQGSVTHTSQQEPATGLAQGPADQLRGHITVPAMDFRPFRVSHHELSRSSLQEQLADCSAADASKPADAETNPIQLLRPSDELDIALLGQQHVRHSFPSCASPLLAFTRGVSASPLLRQDSHQRPAPSLSTPTSVAATAELAPFGSYGADEQLPGFGSEYPSQQHGCSQHSNGAALDLQPALSLCTGFTSHIPQQQQGLPCDGYKSNAGSQALLREVDHANSDSPAISITPRRYLSSPGTQLQQSQGGLGQVLDSQSEQQASGTICHGGYASMPDMTGLIGGKNGRLKRKLSGDIAECGSNLDLFNLQRELLLTQNELRLLRQQYFQLRQVCQDSMQVMASASNSSVFSAKSDLLAKQPGVWQGVSVPVAKRRAILDQDSDLLQVPPGQWWTPQTGSERQINL